MAAGGPLLATADAAVCCAEVVSLEPNPSVLGGLLAARLGFEPRQTDPESAVLPLHHRANGGGKRMRSATEVKAATE